jgi:hypothetical protein
MRKGRGGIHQICALSVGSAAVSGPQLPDRAAVERSPVVAHSARPWFPATRCHSLVPTSSRFRLCLGSYRPVNRSCPAPSNSWAMLISKNVATEKSHSNSTDFAFPRGVDFWRRRECAGSRRRDCTCRGRKHRRVAQSDAFQPRAGGDEAASRGAPIGAVGLTRDMATGET